MKNMKDYEAKMDIMMLMVENGYYVDPEIRTMDEYCTTFTLEDIKNFAKAFFAYKGMGDIFDAE